MNGSGHAQTVGLAAKPLPLPALHDREQSDEGSICVGVSIDDIHESDWMVVLHY